MVPLHLSINSSDIFRTRKQELTMFINRGVAYLFWFLCLCWWGRLQQIARAITSGRILQTICDSAKVTPLWPRGSGLRLFFGATLARTTWMSDMMDAESGTPCAQTWEACCCLYLRMAGVPMSVVSSPQSWEMQCLSHSFCPTASCLQLLVAFTHTAHHYFPE